MTAAIHSGISALDALTAQYRGSRASGNHAESLLLIKGIFSPQEYGEIKKQFTSLIDKKNTAEYQPDLMDAMDAHDAARWAERIVDRVKKKML